MSVVSELRALADELDRRSTDPNNYQHALGVSAGLRRAAQTARLRALRAETSVLARTDERPRFARLVAPQRPPARSPYDVVIVNLGTGAVILAPDTVNSQQLVYVPSDASRRIAVEEYRCANCGKAGLWHRGVLTPPVPRPRLCETCKTSAGPCARCDHDFDDHAGFGCGAADDCGCPTWQKPER